MQGDVIKQVRFLYTINLTESKSRQGFW